MKGRGWFLPLVMFVMVFAVACSSPSGTQSPSAGNEATGTGDKTTGSSNVGTQNNQNESKPDPAPSKPSYPEKAIRVVVTHGAGGSTDIPGRLIQPYAEEILGQPLVFENMTGAGGAIARNFVYKAPADGYTLMVTQLPSLSSGVYTGKVEYEPLEFTHLYSITGRDYLATAVPADSPYQTLDDLLKAAEEKELTVGGSAGSSLIAIALYHKMGGKFRYIPFNVTSETATALGGKQIDVGVTNVSGFAPLVEQGLLRILAVHGEERHPGYPEFPTVVELGRPELAVEQVTGVFGPPGMPEEVVNVLGEAFVEAGKDQKYLHDVEVAKLNPQPLGPEEFKQFHEKIHQQIESIKDILIDLGGGGS